MYSNQRQFQSISFANILPLEEQVMEKGCKQEYKQEVYSNLNEQLGGSIFRLSQWRLVFSRDCQHLSPQFSSQRRISEHKLVGRLRRLVEGFFKTSIQTIDQYEWIVRCFEFFKQYQKHQQNPLKYDYTFFEFAINQPESTANKNTYNFFLWEQYIPDQQSVMIQAFNQDILNSQYQLTIKLEFLKENDSNYNELIMLFIQLIANQNPNADLYFLEFGKVLRTYCLVDKQQIKVFEKAIMILNEFNNQNTLLTIVMAGLDFQDVYIKTELTELIGNHKSILFFNHTFKNNMKIILKLNQTRNKIEENSTFGHEELLRNVNYQYNQLQSHQNQIVFIQNFIKLSIKRLDHKKILLLYFKNPNNKLSIYGFSQILLNIINLLEIGCQNKSIEQEVLKNVKTLLLNKLFLDNTRQQQNPMRQSLCQVNEVAIIDLMYYSEPGNRHFPEKRLNCVKCKVCRRKAAVDVNSKAHKTKYRCKGCFIKYQRNINLCITPCFEEFHSHPDYYLVRNKPMKQLAITGLNSKKIGKLVRIH